MSKNRPFSIAYAAQFVPHLNAIEKKFHALVRRSIEEQLFFQPNVETRNRKPLAREVDFGATWELRFGPDNRFRLFYSIDEDKHEVLVITIGMKVGNRLWIGGQEIEI